MFCHMEACILELDGTLENKTEIYRGHSLYPDRLCCVLSVVESLHPQSKRSASAILTDEEGSLVYFKICLSIIIFHTREMEVCRSGDLSDARDSQSIIPSNRL